MRKLLINSTIISGLLFTMAACGGGSEQEHHDHEHNNGDHPQEHMEHDGHHHEGDSMPHEGQHHQKQESKAASVDSVIKVKQSKSMSAVIDAYLEVKNALVQDNDQKAATAGKRLVKAFNNLDQSSIAQDKQSKFKDIIVNAKEQAEHISENAGDIAHQREHLQVLSVDMKDMMAITGTDRTLYQEFCPMYNDNEGAMWLSASSDIKNPFYGNEMLKCGRVEAKITAQ